MAYAEQILQPIYYDTGTKEDFSDEVKIDHGNTGYGI
jgi:hypothetical protein